MTLPIRLMAPLAAALVVAACGGGGGGDAPPQAVDPLAGVPATAGQSADGLIRYISQLPPLDAEMRDPMVLDGFMPPTREDTEPHDPAGS
jgi:ABC-type glycerol-3-phosphate transport system substrate-binding protein